MTKTIITFFKKSSEYAHYALDIYPNQRKYIHTRKGKTKNTEEDTYHE